MAILPGFSRLAGASRRYAGPDDVILSRRQYDALVRAAGKRQTMAPQRYATQVRSQRHYNRILNAYAKQQRATARDLSRETERLLALTRERQRNALMDLPALERIETEMAELQALVALERLKHSKKSVRESAEFKKIVRDIKQATKRKKGQPLSPENKIKLRDALKRAGLRDAVPDWVPPGLSDQYKRGKIVRARQIRGGALPSTQKGFRRPRKAA